MSFTLKSCLQRLFLTRLLQATGLSLALMMASAVGVHAENVTVQGKDGTSGIGPDFMPGDGESVTASAGSAHPITSPLNTATAIGGNGGGAVLPLVAGGSGGAATATAGTTIIFGSASADAAATGGIGGDLPSFPFPPTGEFTSSGWGGAATASATGSTGSGNATVSASAVGGNAGFGDENGGKGGDANASSTAQSTGSGAALSSAFATGGEGGVGFQTNGIGGNATAMADASAAGGGKAIATAVATTIAGENGFLSADNANATSNAETVKGAMAQALSTVVQGASLFAPGGQATSTAKTSLTGVSVQSTTAALVENGFDPSVTATTDAIAQGGSGQTLVDPGETAAISTALPDKAYAATLIGGASNVADALLGPHDEIFGTAILASREAFSTSEALFPSASSTFDFRFQGDLLLGVIEGFDFDIIVNGAPIFTGGSVTDTVINLGSNFGPNIDLTIEGDGVFALGGVVSETAVPETSTWAMMMLGFAGLGFVG